MILRINAFLQYVSEHKLWSLTWVCFGAVFWFLVSVYGTLPQRIAEFSRFSVTADNYKADGDRVLFLYDALAKALGAYVKAARHYQTNFASRPTSEVVDYRNVPEGLRLSIEAERASYFATGAIAGTRFQNSELNSFREKFESDMREIGGIATDFVKFHERLVANDRTAALEAMKRISPARREEKAVELETRVKDFNKTAQNIQQENTLEVDKKSAEQWFFWLTVYATIPALLFEGAVLLIGVRSFISYNREQQTAKGRTKRKSR
jgi:hypothetical protein